MSTPPNFAHLSPSEMRNMGKRMDNVTRLRPADYMAAKPSRTFDTDDAEAYARLVHEDRGNHRQAAPSGPEGCSALAGDEPMNFPVIQLAFMARWPLVPVAPDKPHKGWILKVKPNMERHFMQWLKVEGWS